MSLPPEQEAAYSAIIDSILAHSDLTTISAKRIRKELQARIDYDISHQKDLINDLIGRRFDKAAEQQQLDPTKSEPTEPVPTAAPPPAGNGVKSEMINGFVSPPGAASTGATYNSEKRSPGTQDDHPSGISEVADSPSPKKKHKKNMSVEDADAAYAARLQAEENSRARSTRGGGGAKRKPVVKKENKKRKSKNRVGSDDDSDAEGSPKKEVNRNSGFHKPMILSHSLSTLLGETQLSRPQTVKRIWEYIKEHDLQDPNDKRQIRCDNALRAIFKTDSVHMFTMNKILNQNLYPIDE